MAGEKMNEVERMPTHCGDATCAACVVAGNTIYLAHHTGGHEKKDIEHQMHAAFKAMEATLASAGAKLSDLVQINLYLRELTEFRKAANVFDEYLQGSPVARMTTTTEFIEPNCLCMMDGVAYKARK